jgi:hypothetical protein
MLDAAGYVRLPTKAEIAFLRNFGAAAIVVTASPVSICVGRDPQMILVALRRRHPAAEIAALWWARSEGEAKAIAEHAGADDLADVTSRLIVAAPAPRPTHALTASSSDH